MMEEDDAWFYILPINEIPKYCSIEGYLSHNGKWMVYGPKDFIEQSASKIKNLVGKKEIIEAKYSKMAALEVPKGYEFGKDYVLIAYCDDRKKEEVRNLLEKELDIKELFWRYDRETWKRMIEQGEEVPEDIKLILKNNVES